MRSQARVLMLLVVSAALALVGLVAAPPPPAAAAGLALDASTPAVVKAKGTTLTTASFTPPAGSVLVISAQSNGNSDGQVHRGQRQPQHPPDVHAGPDQGQHDQRRVRQALLGAGHHLPGDDRHGDGRREQRRLRHAVRAGVHRREHRGPHRRLGGGRGATGVISDSYTSTASGSWGWLSYGDWAQKGVPKVPSTETVQASYNVAGEDTFALIKQNATTAAAGTQVTMSTTSPTSGARTTHIYFEVVPADRPRPLRTDDFLADRVTGVHPVGELVHAVLVGHREPGTDADPRQRGRGRERPDVEGGQPDPDDHLHPDRDQQSGHDVGQRPP